jgi:cardiolipin synthase (CMP-forming)
VISQRVKDRLSNLTPRENIYTLPNILTFSRLLAAPAIGYLVLHDQHVWAVGLFAYAGITDLVDGWIARRWKLQTVVGSVIDPMADKALMTVLVGCLAANGALPREFHFPSASPRWTSCLLTLEVWLAAIIFGRDMSLGFAAIYYRYASLPLPKTFLRYWDFSLPSAEVHPTTVSKYNTFLQLCVIGATTALPLVTDAVLPGSITAANVSTVVTGAQYLVAGTTLWSGLDYVWDKKVVTILGDNEELKKKQGFRGRAIIGVSFACFAALAAWLAAREQKMQEKEDIE